MFLYSESGHVGLIQIPWLGGKWGYETQDSEIQCHQANMPAIAWGQDKTWSTSHQECALAQAVP